MKELKELMKYEPYFPENNEDDKDGLTWEYFLEAAQGNIKYALLLRQRVNGQSPETLIYEDIREGEVFEINGQFVITGGNDEIQPIVDEILEGLYLKNPDILEGFFRLLRWS